MHVGRLFPAHMKFLNRFVHTSYFLRKKKDLKVFNAKDLLGISLFYTLIKNNKKCSTIHVFSKYKSMDLLTSVLERFSLRDLSS